MERRELALMNIDAAFDFLGHLVDHPSELESIQNGANVVFVPSDRPELAKANLEMAERLIERHHHQHESPTGSNIALTPGLS